MFASFFARMKSPPLVRFLAAVLSLLILCARARASDPVWLEVRSPHFSVVTDAGEKRGREVALRFEQMRMVFGALLTKANVNLPVPLQIVAFRSTKEMRQFAPLYHGKPTQVAGLFQGGEDRSFILLDMSVENPFQVVFHEYAHQLMNGNISAETQPWFEEGFAEYFSTIVADGKQAQVGRVQQDDFDVLMQARLWSVAQLFRVQHYSDTYNQSGEGRSLFYAESWLVVHYLYDTQQIPKLHDYFDAVTVHNLPVEDAVQKSFGMSVQQLDKALAGYLRANRFVFHALPVAAGPDAAAYTVNPVSSLDAQAVLADMHLHSPDHQEQAMTEFQALLKVDPENDAALRGLGYAYLMKQDYDRAGEYFQKAAQKNARDPRVLYYSALLTNREGRQSADPAKLQTMVKELEASIALDPNFADAYSLLGFAESSLGDTEKGVEATRKAVSLSPRNEGYRFNLAEMYLSDRKPDEAIAILETLVHSANPQLAEQANRALAEAHEYKLAVSAGSEVHVVNGPARITHGAEKNVLPADPEPTGPAPDSPPLAAVASSPVLFVKGKLTSVDCSTPPGALVAVVTGTKTLKLKVRDVHHAIVIGADELSCDWKDRKVAVNYREGPGGGDVVSIEVQ